MNWQELLILMGINDVNAAAQMFLATSKTGPNFKAAAQAALTANSALAIAAQNPSE
jgi:hypothetical protein